jgi:tRNA(Ile)-lysidine synthase
LATVLDQVRQFAGRYGLPRPGDRVVVGVSGGPDSLCLLHCLCRLKKEFDLAMYVAHLHHGLRGEEAAADAEFVRELAGDWGLPCVVESVDVPALAAEHRLAVEEAARRARYGFLSRVAKSAGAGTIAVGHNADDQAETVLMHFIRGSGLAGLRGMLPVTALGDYRLLESVSNRPADPLADSEHPATALRLIRPLLDVTRADIASYCDFYALEPRFDRSNLDTTYFRNWLRHELLPMMARHNPNVEEVIRRSARVIADEQALLRSLLEEVWPQIVLDEPPASAQTFSQETSGEREGVSFGALGVRVGRPAYLHPDAGRSSPTYPPHSEEIGSGRITFDLAAWRALPTALQRSTLREAIHRLRRSLRNINFVHVENALVVARDGTTGDQATLPRGLMLKVGYDRITLADTGVSDPLPHWPLLPAGTRCLSIVVPGRTGIAGSRWVLETEIVERERLREGWEENSEPWQAYLDADQLGTSLCLRTRQPGDRFQPLGLRGHSTKLADFFTNHKVPRPTRDRLPLLVSEGAIAWVCGWRVDERARASSHTSRVLVARFVLV